MASSSNLDIAYIVAALIEEAGGALEVSTSWFTSKQDHFGGKQLKLEELDGVLRITLVEGE